MYITGTHINYYLICHRKLWLFYHGINMEHTSDLVAEGKLIHEQSYPQRAEKWKEIEIEGIKIDRFDPKNKIIREIKKSNKKEKAHIGQLKYYIYVLENNGIEVSHGVLEYPKLRETDEVWLTDEDRREIKDWKNRILQIVDDDVVPDIIDRPICRRCAYYEFCYID